MLAIGVYGYQRYQTLKTTLDQPNNVSEQDMKGSKKQCTSLGGRSMLEEVTFQDGKAYFVSTMYPRINCEGEDSYTVETKAPFKAIAATRGDLSTGMIELKQGPLSVTLHSASAEAEANKSSWCGVSSWKINVPQEITRQCSLSGMLSTDYLIDLSKYK